MAFAMSPSERKRDTDRGKEAESATLPGLGRRQLLLILLCGAIALFSLYRLYGLLPRRGFRPRHDPQQALSLKEAAPNTSPQSSTTPPDKPTLRFAIAPVIAPEKSAIQYHKLVTYLAEKLVRHPLSFQRETYAEINEMVRHRQCDIALVCTYAFVRGEREFGMNLLVAPEINASVDYYSYIIVPKTNLATDLMELRGKRFASADLMSNSGWLFPALWLRDRGVDPMHFFAEHIISGSHDRSVRAVASEIADGAAVDNLVYEQMLEEDPALSEQTRIIMKSPPFGMPPLVCHPDLEPSLRQEMLGLLLSMDRDPDGRKVLSELRIDRFVIPDQGLYQSVRDAARNWEQW
jgi:phosphonate transport system substrate-binding protein